MGRLDFLADDKQLDLANKKAKEMIDILSDVDDVQMKAFILFQLVHSFKDITGLDVCKSLAIYENEDRYI